MLLPPRVPQEERVPARPPALQSSASASPPRHVPSVERHGAGGFGDQAPGSGHSPLSRAPHSVRVETWGQTQQCRSYFIAVVLPAGGGRTPRPGIRVARAPDDGLAGSRLPLLRVRPSTPGPKEAKQALDPGWWHVHRQAPSRGRARAWLVCLGGVGTRRARLRMVRGPGGPAVLCCGETVASLSQRKGTWALKAGCPQIPSPFTAL